MQPPRPLSLPGAKLTLALSLTMTLVGFFGLSGSLSALTSSGDELAEGVVTPIQAPMLELSRAAVDSPMRKALAVGNLLASGLLLVASFLLTARSGSGLWWARQACYANLLYSLASAVVGVLFIQKERALFMAVIQAQTLEAASESGVPPPDLSVLLPIFMAAAILFALFMCAIYGGMLRISRREDVRRFVQREV